MSSVTKKCFRTFLLIAIVALSISVSAETGLSNDNKVGKPGQSKTEVINDKQLFEQISKAKGKVIVVNFWATWCPPCVKEFPDFMKLHDEYKKSKEFILISVSVDHPDTINKSVKPFVEKHKVPFKVGVLKSDSPEDLMKAFNSDWAGGVPATFVYDKEGKQVHSWFEETTLKDLKGVVEPLIKKTGTE